MHKWDQIAPALIYVNMQQFKVDTVMVQSVFKYIIFKVKLTILQSLMFTNIVEALCHNCDFWECYLLVTVFKLKVSQTNLILYHFLSANVSGKIIFTWSFQNKMSYLLSIKEHWKWNKVYLSEWKSFTVLFLSKMRDNQCLKPGGCGWNNQKKPLVWVLFIEC